METAMSMHRELNPQLFGNATPVEKIGQPVDPSQPAAGIMGRTAAGEVPTANRPVAYPPIDIKAIEGQVNALRSAHLQLEKRTDAIQSQLQELARTTNARLERFTAAIVRLEETMSQGQRENTTKFAQIVAKVNERKVSDNKVTELLDRHNHIIRNFENRLLALQRLVSEQEMALHNSQAALEEARSEIVRLKRL
jgi:chromosome segregation ATPase